MFPLVGCWDLHELNEISVVAGMAVDKGQKYRYKLTVEAMNAIELAGKRGTGAAPAMVYSQEGDLFSELMHRMTVGLSRKMIYSHMRVFAVSDSVAKEGMLDFLDFLERDREIRDDFNIVIAKGVRAEDVISTTFPRQKVPSIKIFSQIDAIYKEWGGDPKIRLKDMISALTSPGRQPAVEMVTIKGDPKKGNITDNNKALRQDALVVVDGMAVFRQGRMIGSLTLHDVQNYVWTQNLLKEASISILCSKDKRFGVRIYNSRTHIKTHYQGSTPQIEIGIDLEGFLAGSECGFDMEKMETYKKMEVLVNRSIETRILGTIQKVQKEYGVDIFGFGEDMYRQDKEAFKKVRNHWDEEFKKAKVVVNADLKMRRSGIRTKSFLNELK